MAKKKKSVAGALGLGEEREGEIQALLEETIRGKDKVSDIIRELCDKNEELDMESVLVGYYLADTLGKGIKAEVIGIIGIGIIPEDTEGSEHRPVGENIAG